MSRRKSKPPVRHKPRTSVSKESDRVKLAKELEQLLGEAHKLESLISASGKAQNVAECQQEKIIDDAKEKFMLVREREQNIRAFLTDQLELLNIKIRQAQRHMSTVFDLSSHTTQWLLTNCAPSEVIRNCP